MKIILVGLTHPFRGGIAHFTTSLYRALLEEHQVQLISFSRLYPKFLFPGKTQFDHSDTPFQAPILARLNSLNPLTWIKTARLIRRQQPDMILFMWWNPILAFCYFFTGMLCRGRTPTKIVFYCHNVFPHEESPVAKLLTRIALKTPDIFMCQSSTDMQTLERLFPGKPCLKTFHPLYDIFPKKNTSRDEARKILGLGSNVLLFFGHIRKYKGLETLLQALPRVLKEVSCTLVIAGEFYEPRQKFDQIISEQGLQNNVIIKDDYIDNEMVETYFVAADTVVLPYTSASQSGVIPLAYHYNIPVIATKVGGLQDIVQHQKTGYLVPSDNPEQLAIAILEFFKNRESIDFAGNIQTLKVTFSWQALAHAIANSVAPHRYAARQT